MEYTVIIKGFAVAAFLWATIPDPDIRNYKWWIAMLSIHTALAF